MAVKPQRKRGHGHFSLFSKEGLSILKRCETLSSVDPHSLYHEVEENDRDYDQLLDSGTETRRIVSTPNLEDPRCTSCGVTFANRQDQVAHYKLDWHKYNLKRKLKGLSCVGEDEFETLSDNISSLSGSDSSDNEADRPLPTVQEDLSSLSVKATGKKTTQHNSPLLKLKTANNHVYGVYPHILYHPKSAPESSSETKEALDNLIHSGSDTIWIVLMKSGGHFAGGVFRGSSCVVHKTFHRYTVRAKRGTSQSARDSKHGGHQLKSAGATLRRFNEAALEQDIAKLFEDWGEFITEAASIFVRVPTQGRSSFFTAPLSKDDPRVRGIPLITRRPTLNEVKRVHQVLSTIYDFGIVEVDNDPNPNTSTLSRSTDNKSCEVTGVAGPPRLVNVDSTDQPTLGGEGDGLLTSAHGNKDVGKSKGMSHRKDKGSRLSPNPKHPRPTGINKELLHHILSEAPEDSQDKNLEDLLKILKKHNVPCVQDNAFSQEISTIVNPARTRDEDQSGECSSKYKEEEKAETTSGACPLNEQFCTTGSHGELTSLLHISSQVGQSGTVWALMEHGADPAIKDSSGRNPYHVAKDKATRDMFRKFMAVYPDLYNFSAAQIPSPLTVEMEALRKEKQAERNRIKKKQKKQKDKISKEIKEERKVEEVKKTTEQNLSEREKRALAAERRILKITPDATSVLSSAGNCSYCQRTLAGMVPFTRLDFKYCSMDCVKNHKTAISTTKP